VNAPAPCPFCGAELVPQSAHTPSMGWLHPPAAEPGRCPIAAGFLLRPIMFEAWNRRVEIELGFTTLDLAPVFNDKGEGRPVTASFLNACFDYVRKQTR